MVALLAYLLTVKLCHILEQCPHFETYFSANFGVECSKNNGVQFVSVGYLKDCNLQQPAIRYESVAVVNSH